MNATIGDALILGAQKIEEGLTKIAPGAWEIIIRQQYADVAGYLLGVIIIIIILCYSKKFLTTMRDKKDKNGNIIQKGYAEEWGYDNEMTVRALLIVAIIISIIFLICFLVIGTKVLINPEYYAIKEMTYMLRSVI